MDRAKWQQSIDPGEPPGLSARAASSPHKEAQQGGTAHTARVNILLFVARDLQCQQDTNVMFFDRLASSRPMRPDIVPLQPPGQPVHDPFVAQIHAQLDRLESTRALAGAGGGAAARTETCEEQDNQQFVRAVGRQYQGLGGRTWEGEWTFALMADVQLGMLEGNYPASGESWETEKEMAARCVAHINAIQPRPKFVIVCGDLVDQAPPAARSTVHQPAA